MSMSTQNWEIVHYFDYSDAGIEVEEEGLTQMRFGEYLVERGQITRAQLLSALMEQDRCPGTAIGALLVAMGVIDASAMHQALHDFQNIPVLAF